MRIEFDRGSDLLKVELVADVPVAERRDTEGMTFGYSADRRIVAIEIRGARGRIHGELMKLLDPGLARSAA